VIVGGAFYGDVNLAADGSFTYTPPPGFVGQDSFTYVWADVDADGNVLGKEGLESDFARVTIDVASRAPIAGNDEFLFGFTNALVAEFDLLSNDTDADGDTLTVEILAPPEFGSLTDLSNGMFRYVSYMYGAEGELPPTINDGFTYRISDGVHTSLVARVSIGISPIAVFASTALIQGEEQIPLGTVVLAGFVTLDPALEASDFTASILWGDSTATSVGIIEEVGDGSFIVKGPHTYDDEGNYEAYIEVEDAHGIKGGATKQIFVADSPAVLSGDGFTTAVGLPYRGSLASFLDDKEFKAKDFSAQVNWGDGTGWIPALVTGGGGNFSVIQGHTYDEPGEFTVDLEVTDCPYYHGEHRCPTHRHGGRHRLGRWHHDARRLARTARLF
jgi:hypothetical protein